MLYTEWIAVGRAGGDLAFAVYGACGGTAIKQELSGSLEICGFAMYFLRLRSSMGSGFDA
ncbi:hypothetical protein KPC83_01070 [Collinsella sp. zg1085]|uniref:hypothetical protein n=1 Tax=Collinsella sp. zg1085 TaxID=2844380 RepID=UPI001C0BEB05|nr:hypothetical protein [Collinsella sp. zg1085]QWT17783.1 hypothetical protein KPC83_01070 [Collinsella sp. zg1085]